MQLGEPVTRPVPALESDTVEPPPGTTVPDRDTSIPLPGTLPSGLEDALALQAPFLLRVAAAMQEYRSATDHLDATTELLERARSDRERRETALAEHDDRIRTADSVAAATQSQLATFAQASLIAGRRAEEGRRQIDAVVVQLSEARLLYLRQIGQHLATTSFLEQADADARRQQRTGMASNVEQADAAVGAAEHAVGSAMQEHGRALAALDSAAALVAPNTTVVEGIPDQVLNAYVRAAQRAAVSNPGCGMTWWALAAVGRVESGNAGGRAVSADGRVEPAVLGPRLTGVGGSTRISDSDGGVLDGDPSVDRAVGPMQFIPSTWMTNGTDASGDGIADPHNIFDAAFTAARYLCAAAGGLRVDTEAGFRRAAYAYNRSGAYVDKVWDVGEPYRQVAADHAATLRDEADAITPLPPGG